MRLFGDDIPFNPFAPEVIRAQRPKRLAKKGKNTKFAMLGQSGPGFQRYGDDFYIFNLQAFSVFYGNPCIASIKRNANFQNYKVSTSGNTCTLTLQTEGCTRKRWDGPKDARERKAERNGPRKAEHKEPRKGARNGPRKAATKRA
jgi:hypothetical protein